MLTPEKMSRFRVVVPLENKFELLDALRTFGIVALKGKEAEHVMPALLEEVLERRITPENINIDEAEKIVKRILREDDLLRREFEKYVEKYREIRRLRKIVKSLKDMGIPPTILTNPGIGLAASYIYLRGEASPIVKDLTSIGVLVKTINLAENEYFLLLLYPKKLEKKVEEVKEKYKNMIQPLPEWFTEGQGDIESRLEKEERRVRKDILSVLQEIASVIKDAIEFERTSAHEVFSNAYMSILEVKKRLRRLQELISQLAALEVAKNVLEEKDIKKLKELGLGDVHIHFADHVIRGIPVDTEGIETKLCSRNVPSELCSRLQDEAEKYVKGVLIRSVIERLEKEGVIGSSDSLWIHVFIGSSTEIEGLLSKLKTGKTAFKTEKNGEKIEIIMVDGRYVMIEKFDVFGYMATVIITDNKKIFDDIQGININNIIHYTITPSNAPKSSEKIRTEVKRFSTILLAMLILTGLKEGLVDVDKLLISSGDKKLIELHRRIVELMEGRVKIKLLPEDGRLQVIKSIIDNAEIILGEIKDLEDEVEAEIDELAIGDKKGREAVLGRMASIINSARDILAYELTIEVLYKAQSSLNELRIFRNKRIVIAEGYLPSRLKPLFLKILEEKIPRILYIKIRDVKLGEEAPTYIRHRGLLKYFYTLTEMLGTPSYWEINPTPIFTLLFITMYGMMFGDIGQGIFISLFGLWLYKTKYRLFGISEKGAQTLGALAILAGISAAVFGGIYGCLVFLYPLCPHVALIRPLEDMMGIIVVALLFGVLQLFISFTLSTINHLRVHDYGGALFGGTSLLGIIYYAAGVYIVYKLAEHGFDLTMLGSPALLPGVAILLGSIAALLGYGVVKFILTKESEHVMESLSELIEMMIAYPANSLSYIRLAAFAMAHEAFGLLAEGLVPMAGFVASYIIANFFVLAIEALAVGIQSLRLLYYEFSTKFYKGTGIPFEPLVKVEVDLEKMVSAS